MSCYFNGLLNGFVNSLKVLCVCVKLSAELDRIAGSMEDEPVGCAGPDAVVSAVPLSQLVAGHAEGMAPVPVVDSLHPREASVKVSLLL